MKLIFHKEKIADMDAFLALCPFGALGLENGEVCASAACRLCRLCVKNGGGGAEVIEDAAAAQIDKTLWKNVCVYADHTEGVIHPVTMELLGKARTLADKISQSVYAVIAGDNITEAAKELLHYGADKVFVYDYKALRDFTLEAYSEVLSDFIEKVRPSSILVGATVIGRQLAPRVAARFKTGLTADCTILDMKENTDLVQIRPAFGGNIMAQICTPTSRPQMATVRYKVMNAPQRSAEAHGEIVMCDIAQSRLECAVKVISLTPKEKATSIENADVLVVAGRGVKSKDDLLLIERLADALGGSLACTRPLVECGWVDARRQIGLSGRSVRPQLIITCGVSGAIQFVAGMNNSENIFAINTDPDAPIFKAANYGIVGDLYTVVPRLIKRLEAAK